MLRAGCWLFPILPCVALLFVGCGGCGRAPAPATSVPDGGTPRATWEFQPFDSSVLQHAGKVDLENHYASTVMVAVDEPPLTEECSGVLLAPRLALTAAHCVCMKRKGVMPDGQPATLIDSSACARRATVTTVLYTSTENPSRPSMRFRALEGRIQPHPEFKLLLDPQGLVASSHGDLAVILLDTPIKTPLSYAPLSETELRVDEPLHMVGYGNDELLGSIHGMRYFRKNRVTEPPSFPGDRARYEQQGPYVYHGYVGGPCFRENERGRWLAGIASVGSPKELSLTSTWAHRAWLRAELQRASQETPSLGPP